MKAGYLLLLSELEGPSRYNRVWGGGKFGNEYNIRGIKGWEATEWEREKWGRILRNGSRERENCRGVVRE